MDVALVAIVVAALGVSFGWQPSKEDPAAYEVVMQVEPELVDVLQAGRQIPIESHVPPSVTPIRNIRIVVGTDELPRTPLVVTSHAKTQAERIVRGQEESPLEHMTRFQNDDGWSGDRYAPTSDSSSRQFDQRGATIGIEPIRTAASSPSRSSRSGWSAPPPLFESGQSTPTSASPNQSTTPAAWSSIRPELAPPRLATPRMTDSVRMAGNPSAGRVSAGPSFSPPPTTSDPQLRSVLAAPTTTSTAAAEQDWSSGWGSSSSASTAAGNSDVGMVPVPPRLRSDPNAARQAWPPASPPSASVTANSSPTTPQLGDRYTQPAPTTSPANSGTDAWANFGQPQGHTASNIQPQTQPPQTQSPPIAAPMQSQPIAQQGLNTQPVIAVPPAAERPANSDEVPWKPLIVVMLALAGSVGANIFLGMSYADARHRYRMLVAKTTHSFQKAAGIAA